jgi:hypothetical protein
VSFSVECDKLPSGDSTTIRRGDLPQAQLRDEVILRQRDTPRIRQGRVVEVTEGEDGVVTVGFSSE